MEDASKDPVIRRRNGGGMELKCKLEEGRNRGAYQVTWTCADHHIRKVSPEGAFEADIAL